MYQCDNPRCKRCWRIYGGNDECKGPPEPVRKAGRDFSKIVSPPPAPTPTRVKLVKWVSEIPSKKHPGVIYRLEIRGQKLECRCPVYKRGHICKHVRKEREKLKQLPLF